jgi:hypothetical protein
MVEVGRELIDELQRQLKVEERWALADESGRTWWLSALPLRIWADEVAVPDSVPWIRVHAATVVAEGVDPNPDVYRAIAAENNVAIMSALVLDTERRELSLRRAHWFRGHSRSSRLISRPSPRAWRAPGRCARTSST